MNPSNQEQKLMTENVAPITASPAPAAPRGTELAGDATPARSLEQLPSEVGAMLVSVGALGVVLPGMAGAPALVMGGMVLWPKTFAPVDRWLQRRFPDTHNLGMKQIARYLDDLDRRFPRPQAE